MFVRVSEIRYEDRPWLKNYVPGVPTSIDYQEICIPHMLENTAEKFPDQTALIFQGYFVTYQELKDMVDRFA